MTGYHRSHKSRAQLEFEASKEAFEALVAEKEAEEDEDRAHEIAKRRRLTQGKRFTRVAPEAGKRKFQKARLELTANRKRLIAEDLAQSKSQFSTESKFWQAMTEKHGLSKKQLSRIVSQSQAYAEMSKAPLRRRNSKNKKRVRVSGAGRKVPYPEVLATLSQWLAVERACGHTISQQDFFQEFLFQLRLSATKSRLGAEERGLSNLKVAELQQDAEDKEARAEKLSKSKAYRRSFTEKLLRWTKAKFTTSEVVSNISSLESQVRCKLTWQEFDWCLWLASLSSLPELSAEKRVSDPEDFVKNRAHLAIGFSDQVPLWAKATGRKAVFSAEELHSAETTKDFSEVREAIEDAMRTDSDATFQVVPISDTGDSTPGVKKALSFGSEGSGTVRRALSFSSLSPEKPLQTEEKAEEEQQQRFRHSQKGPEHQQPKKKQKKALPKAGAKTTLGFSADERFRITYEARQVLLQVLDEPSKPVVGLVGKGLLVVPGQWARLSNISQDGKWIRTERFRVGAKEKVHSAGASVGKILLSYRKLRQAHPELVAKLDIMSQPAANVDSVILSWVIEGQATEYPCSVWQRDCFSSVFSDTAAESMALAQQISCLVAAKCTSKLQITDSDFAREFKAAVRHKLSSLRTEFQEQQKFSGKSEVWRVGALEIVTSVVWAEEQLRQKNEEQSWVVRAAVRNGLLAYRPNPETGRLETVSEQPWAKELDLRMGSRRFPASWLSERLKWLDDAGKPIQADWSLSDSAKQISDLIRWDYFNPEEDLEHEPEDGGFDLDADLAEDLDLSLQNSLSLRLHPKLRRAAARRALEEGYTERVKDIRKKAELRRERLKHRTAFRGKLLQSLRQKLMLSSRAEALSQVVPVRTETKGQKLSATTKPSAKNKPSAKSKASKFLKASAKKKAAKKHEHKATVDKVIAKVTAKKKKEKKAKAKAEPTKTETEPSALLAPFLEKEVICVSEAAGHMLFGIKGLASDFQSGRYTVMTVSGTFEIRSEHLTLWEPKTPEFVWAQLKYLSRADTQAILRAISCWPEPKLSYDDYADHGLVPFPETEKPFLVEDQWIWQGWAMMSWSLRKAKAGSFEEFSVECLDPGLPHLLFEFPEHLLEPREDAVKKAFSNGLRLLVPLVRALHWTLLVAQRESEGFQWRLYDSLQEPIEACTLAQVRIGSLLDPQFSLPKKTNSAVQPQGSLFCGFYVLAWMEQEVRQARGEWLRVWPGLLAKTWKERLLKMKPHLEKEQKLRIAEIEKAYNKTEAERKEAEKRVAKAQHALDTAKASTTKAAVAAKESLDKNLFRFTWKHLSKEATAKILALEHSPGICQNCRWQTGCPQCQAEKALKYHLTTEAAAQGKLPFQPGLQLYHQPFALVSPFLRPFLCCRTQGIRSVSQRDAQGQQA